MQNIRHESLEPHVFDTRDQLCRLEILIGRISAALAQVVHKIPKHLLVGEIAEGKLQDALSDFSESAAFFAEVHNDADATTLCAPYALLNGEDQVGLAGADVRAKHVRTIAYRLLRQCQETKPILEKQYTHIRHGPGE